MEPTGEMTTSSSPVGSLDHASHSAQQESETERQMTATSGRKCLESLERLNRLGLLAKMLLASSRWTAGLYSRKYALRWRMKGTPSKRLYCQLFPVERRTEEIGFGLLLTPGVVMHEESPEDYKARTVEKNYNRGNEWTSLAAQIAHMDLLPTPRAFMYKDANYDRGKSNLGEVIAGILGTPTSRDWKDTGDMTNVPENGLLGRQIANMGLLQTPRANKITPQSREDFSPNLAAQIEGTNGANTGMKLQPAFAEFLMGYPENWTRID